MPERDLDRLIALIDARSAKAFAWRRGRCCVSFAAAAVRAQTGVNPIADMPRWGSMRRAAELIDAEGGLVAAIDRRLCRVAPAFAQRGDIAGVPDDMFGIRLMVVEGATLVGPGDTGLERQPRSAMTMAWSATAAEALDG